MNLDWDGEDTGDFDNYWNQEGVFEEATDQFNNFNQGYQYPPDSSNYHYLRKYLQLIRL